MAAQKKLTPFNILFGIPKKKEFSREDVKKSGLSNYLLLNYLKSNNVGVCIGEYLNRNWRIPFYDQYLFALHLLPKQVNYIDFVKQEKVIPNDDLELIRKHYCIDEESAREYYKMISDKQISYLKKLYKTIGE